VIRFRLIFQAGITVHEQVAFAVKKAMVSGQVGLGDAFPSVGVPNNSMRSHPSGSHKVVARLTVEGLLEVQPGMSTIMAHPPSAKAAERNQPPGDDV
jgi:DNA-binding transcriptional regulator YhcF (GntR family)